MFIHHEDDPSGPWFISQASHAWLAWQLACHWGNRRLPRPSLRAETLAAILLHDFGWSDYDAAPSLDEDGRPRAFDRMMPDQHLAIWRSSIFQVAAVSRYAALLVASHFSFLGGLKSADLLERGDTAGARCAEAFIAEMERLRGVWREELKDDPRYRDFLSGATWATNAGVLAACDLISVQLCADRVEHFGVPVATPEGAVELAATRHGAGVWHIAPWPLEGNSLRVHCEARRLPSASFDSTEEIAAVLAAAPLTRLSYTLVRGDAG